MNLRRVTGCDAAQRRLLSRRGEPLFVADWERALFIHFEVDAEALQRDVPFPLDLREGKAYVTLVAFTLRALRMRFFGPLGGLLMKPIATHEFLNVRTYVRHRGEPGIYFLAEWVPNPLCLKLAPALFGLPYCQGKLTYLHDHEEGRLTGCVVDRATKDELRYRASTAIHPGWTRCAEESLDEFLVERYTAFTGIPGKRTRRFFRIWHPPWPQRRVDVTVECDALLRNRWSWIEGGVPVLAHYSPGVRNVWMGWPHRVRSAEERRRSRVSAFLEMP